MAEDLRGEDPGQRAVEARRREIVKEALRQPESCFWTSTMLFTCLRLVRLQHKAVILLPLVLTGLAGVSFVKEWLPAWGVALMAFLATLIPSTCGGPRY
jgi:hypothetical protein